MRTVVSAYAASPAHTRWDPAFEERFLAELVAMDGVGALELPWLGRLHPYDDDWLVSRLPATELVVTALPWTMTRSKESPGYGLASTEADGRAAAMADLDRMRHDLARLPAIPSVVLLHTAPSGGPGSADALRESLASIASWDWCGSTLAIEHCDAVVPGRPFEKGFLSLPDELAALEGITEAGLWLNWGRSLIELRDAAAVTAQVAATAASGRLLGLTLSGAASADGPYGPAWADAHLPFAESDPRSGSLLTRSAARSALRAAGDMPWRGLKVSRRPGDESVAEVLATVEANLAILREAEGTPVAALGAALVGGADG
ncbi:DUF4862 family protein [Leifsonia shinshuensis]|uniref:DUF4862 family protein n=1 Tax=Leifsonia shinshuensis TaxID=150026 RepID=A0A7G6YBI9_9MICO|nr:DUF4862 family protein [Leifsonia shinshuensis]QNE35854.1 DUF4862 family protein [Leifsonia shinshuensis]